MSAGLRNPDSDAREAAALAAILPRAAWTKPDLEAAIAALLSRPGSPEGAFLEDQIRPAIQEFLALALFDGLSRNSVRKALKCRLAANEIRRAANEALVQAGIGAAFGVNVSLRASNRPLLEEDGRAEELLTALTGSGRDRTRPVRSLVLRLARAWDENRGSRITWDGHIDFDDPQSKDAHQFCELVHLIFDNFRDAVAAAGEDVMPTLFVGAPSRKALTIPARGSVNDALRDAVRTARAESAAPSS
jgi:hypothetical protein